MWLRPSVVIRAYWDEVIVIEENAVFYETVIMEDVA